MDILENNVRSECKQAFAELQTDLTDLTMEIESSGIPILPHKTYVMNVFFPGVTEHPVLLKQIPDWQNHDNMFGFSMSQFEKLVLNKVNKDTNRHTYLVMDPDFWSALHGLEIGRGQLEWLRMILIFLLRF